MVQSRRTDGQGARKYCCGHNYADKAQKFVELHGIVLLSLNILFSKRPRDTLVKSTQADNTAQPE